MRQYTVIGLPRTCVGHFRAARGRCGGAWRLHGDGAWRLHGGGAWRLHRGSTWRWQRRNLLFWLAAAALAQDEAFSAIKKQSMQKRMQQKKVNRARNCHSSFLGLRLKRDQGVQGQIT